MAVERMPGFEGGLDGRNCRVTIERGDDRRGGAGQPERGFPPFRQVACFLVVV